MAVLVVFLLTGDHPPLGSSVRYVEACREMLATGEWVIPQLGHVPYLEKPIFAYWIGMISQATFGQGNLAVHLPSGLAVAVMVVATISIARNLVLGRAALVAGVVLLSATQVIGMTSTFTTDPWLAALVTVAWALYLHWDEAGRPRAWRSGGWARWGFWAAIGLGVLTKGPIALALLGLGLLAGTWLAGGWRAPWTTLRDLAPVRGLLIVAAINLPWVVLVAAEDHRLVWFFYVRTNLHGFLDGRINHPGAWWYYGPVLLWSLAPHSPVLLPAAWSAWRTAATEASGGTASPSPATLLAGALLAQLGFLSLSGSKLATYILPLLPLVVVLGVAGLAAPPVWLRRATMVVHALLASALTLVLVVGSVWWWHPDLIPGLTRLCQDRGISIAHLPWLGGGMIALTGAAWTATALCRQARLATASAVLGVGLLILATLIMPRLDRLLPDSDGTGLIHRLQATADLDRDLVVFQSAVVQEYSLFRALGRRPVLLGRLRELGMGHFVEVHPPSTPLPADPYGLMGEALPDHPYLTTTSRLVAAWNEPRRIWIVCESDFQAALGDLVPVILADRAHNLLLLTNHPVVGAPDPE